MVLLSTTQVCKYLVFCWHPNLMPMQISKLLALATTNAKVFNMCNAFKNATSFFFSTHNYINVITI